MSDEQQGWWRRLWAVPRLAWWPLPVGGLVMLLLGAVGLAAMDVTMHATSSTEFCFSCHSHEVNIRAEYEASSHFSNATGVRASCADCHLPSDSRLELMLTKVIVSADIIPELMGELDTPEKWEANRERMANIVWAQYREDDSRFCRDCHNRDAMAARWQSRPAQRGHATAAEEGKTCIDCHAGIVHKLPEGA